MNSVTESNISLRCSSRGPGARHQSPYLVLCTPAVRCVCMYVSLYVRMCCRVTGLVDSLTPQSSVFSSCRDAEDVCIYVYNMYVHVTQSTVLRFCEGCYVRGH